MEPESRIPTHLWVEAEIRRLMDEGKGVYVLARGDKTGGIVLQKISDMAGKCHLFIQQRDLDGRLGWANALSEAPLDEKTADDYITRAVARDPDLWVVEIEDRSLQAILKSP